MGVRYPSPFFGAMLGYPSRMHQMPEYDPGLVLKSLKELREHVLETRRSNSVAIGDKDQRIKLIIECQERLRVLNEVIAEEDKLHFPHQG
jgi:hypothetical protein